MNRHIWLFPPQDDKGCWWYCDSCGTLLNAQLGFTATNDEWTCAECGEVNDVSENNII